MTEPPAAKSPGLQPRRVMIIALASAAIAIVLTLWLGNSASPLASGCSPQPVAAKAIDGAAKGDLAALQPTGTGRGYADLAFVDADGKPHTIKDFAGKSLLVNFWASWCIPCRAEMPALNTLAQKLNGADFMVLPINLDIGDGGLDKARAFLASANAPNLPLYADPSFAAFDRLKTNAVAIGLPATLLLDKKACEIAVLQGPAKWDGADGQSVIAALRALQS